MHKIYKGLYIIKDMVSYTEFMLTTLLCFGVALIIMIILMFIAFLFFYIINKDIKLKYKVICGTFIVFLDAFIVASIMWFIMSQFT